jgi:hypothetical protein
LVQEGSAARPRLFRFAGDRLRLCGQDVEWAYGYSDDTIWQRESDNALLAGYFLTP